MDHPITKDILKNEVYAGWEPAAKHLFTRYSGMSISYILQFVDGGDEAGGLLAEVFLWVEEGLARGSGRDRGDIGRILKEVLLMIRNKLA